MALGVAAAFRAERAGLLLSLADEQHAFLSSETSEILGRQVFLALALLERQQVHAVTPRILLHAANELLADRLHLP